MKVTLLGTCSGTEPMHGRGHTSFVVEHGGHVYWVDAGEGCSRTAHLLGIDLRAVRAIFISHCHIDHTGGLANLAWTMAKLEGRAEAPRLAGRTIPLLIPRPEVWEAASRVAASGDVFAPVFAVAAHSYQDGVIYDEAGVRVTALHNRHVGTPEPGQPWRSFSLRMETAAGVVVFSGDVKDVSEVAPLLPGSDLFLMETGHHKVEDVCRYLADHPTWTGRLVFVHHGRAILADKEAELARAQRYLKDRVSVGEDGMVIVPRFSPEAGRRR